MTDVTFYLLDKADEAQPAHWLLACQLAARCYRKRQKCIVMCSDKASAEAFDELLWQQPLDSFVPHNLTGEGPKGGAPVEISWQSAETAQRPTVINLADALPERLQSYRQIFDFVPAEESAKQRARDRYKHYRAAGMTMHTLPASSIDEKTDG
ncbi:DNA polymerase III subunit chi [Aliiglaciecola litoralis]|uniref:DNA polymerase III subunit chi n=1 Tax=Aliiglaciecola litoralis TaxID=582857 RepID=A0ABP3WZE5_9ALTE